jgi:NitT/TauT family transport system ATP-binding protein
VSREIQFEHVDKVFHRQGAPGGRHYAVKDLTFRINPSEIVAIVGRTGCGKSTAFNLMMGLMAPTGGSVRVMGRDPHAEFNSLRGKIAVVFQSDRLLPWRTALENVCLGLEIIGENSRQRRQVAQEWLRRLELVGADGSYPHQLSGGMRQRVSIARAFALDPEIVLCDESFSALDEVTAEVLRREFVQLVRQQEKTAVFITHSISEALTLGERILVFAPPGHVVEDLKAPDRDDPQDMASCREVIMAALGQAPAGDGAQPEAAVASSPAEGHA